MVKPGLSALTIFTFMGCWNDYLAPLIFLTSNSKKNASAGTEILPGGTQYFVCTFNGGHLNGAYSGPDRVRDGTETDY